MPTQPIRPAELSKDVRQVIIVGDSKLGTAVWIEIGVNNWGFGRSPEELAADYTQLLASIERGPNVTVFCVSMLASVVDKEHRVAANGHSLENMRAVVRNMGNSGLCQYVDTAEWFSAAEIYDSYTMPDGLHLGECWTYQLQQLAT